VSRGRNGLIGFAVLAAIVGLVLARTMRSDRVQAPAPSHAPLEPAFTGVGIDAIASGEDTALAVGETGHVLRYRATDPTWRPMTSPTHAALHGVAIRLGEAVAVGDDGTILELDGDAWKLAPSVTHRALRAVVYSTYGAIAVGDGGTIVRRPAPHEPWRAEPSGTGADFFGACAGLRDVWIVGAQGTIVGHASIADLGDPWKVHASVGTATLRAVACDDAAGIAVGGGGTRLTRLDDVGWHASPSPTQTDLFAVAAPLGTRSWLAVGAHGTAVRFAGEPATLAPLAGWDLRAVTDGPLGTWIGGAGGILRMQP
jgi:hypothetical protein